MKFTIPRYLKKKEGSPKTLKKFLDSSDINEILTEANQLVDSNQFELANELYEYLYTVTSDKFRILNNLSISLRKSYKIDESIKYARYSINQKPDYARTYYGLFESYAYKGDYFNAWKFQEWGFGDNVLSHPSLEMSKQKRLDWDDPYTQYSLFNRNNIQFSLNEPSDLEMQNIYKNIRSKITGKKLYIMSSQGLGDVIQASSLVKELMTFRPNKIIFCVRPELFRVVSYMFKFWPEVTVSMNIPYEEEFDYFIPIFSLFKIFQKDNKPEAGWFNIIDIEKKFYNSLLGNSKGDKIGIIWRGNPKHSNDSKRSLTLENILERLGDLKGKTLYSLQFDATDKEKSLMKENGIIDLSSYIKDLFDTTCFLKNLDLFITVDSAPLHLAGSLGVKTLALIPKHHEDWRWGFEGDNFWYKSVKLIRF